MYPRKCAPTEACSHGRKCAPTEVCSHGRKRAPTEECKSMCPQEPMPCATSTHSVSGSNKETTLILQGVKGGNMLHLLQVVATVLGG